ncbi:hypothetical protein XENOCAPTIV_015721, partial [Xenoophorus captivus]
VQNLNNIMAFPLENVLKSELRDSRLVKLEGLRHKIVIIKLLLLPLTRARSKTQMLFKIFFLACGIIL